MTETPDDLVTIATVRTEFEANTIVALLQDEGIDAFAFGNAQQVFGITLTRGLRGVPVQVREVDQERARDVLIRRYAEAAEIDWEEVDVGDREDALPLHDPKSMPVAARIALVVTIFVAIAAVLAMLIMVVLTLIGGPSSRPGP